MEPNISLAVRALLSNIIDYAGLFPPAQLSLPDALRQYLEHLQGPEKWLVARFVCPATRLAELSELARSAGVGLRVAVVGQAAKSPAEFVRSLREDMARIEGHQTAWGPADVFEVALPAGLDETTATILFHDALPVLAAARLRSFFEIPVTDHWRDELHAVSAALGTVSRSKAVSELLKPEYRKIDRSLSLKERLLAGKERLRRLHPDVHFGLKVRCGGVKAEAFPSVEQLARFIACCRRVKLPWKATAGLHHPLPSWDASLRVQTHGFLPVFSAGVRAWVEDLSVAPIGEILRAPDVGALGLASISAAKIRAIRRRWLPSFGSCSVAEPYADLLALGLIKSG